MQENKLIDTLQSLDQEQLFRHWPLPGQHEHTLMQMFQFEIRQTDIVSARTCFAGSDDDHKRKLVKQLIHLDNSYNGGMAAYIRNAKQLLQDSQRGVAPLDALVAHLWKTACLSVFFNARHKSF